MILWGAEIHLRHHSHHTVGFHVSYRTELREMMGVCSRTVFGVEPSQMSFLFFLMYAAAAGGVLPLLESAPGSAQELKIKVRKLTIFGLSARWICPVLL